MATEIVIAGVAVAALIVSLWQARQTTLEISDSTRARTQDRQPLLRRFENYDQIVNGGGGPAYRALLIRTSGPGKLVIGVPVSVGAGDKPVEAQVGKRVDDPGGILPPGCTWVIVCEDQFDRNLRFLDGGARPDIAASGREAKDVAWTHAWGLLDAPTV
jgi:hypothetical protein